MAVIELVEALTVQQEAVGEAEAATTRAVKETEAAKATTTTEGTEAEQTAEAAEQSAAEAGGRAGREGRLTVFGPCLGPRWACSPLGERAQRRSVVRQ